MSLNNKSVLVTGGAGFIGSHLVDRIIEENPENIVVMDSFFLGKNRNLKSAVEKYPGLKVYNQDITDYESTRKIIEEENIDVAFNLAVIPLEASIGDPVWTFRHNNEIGITMCEIARNDLIDTLIHFSSSEAYGTAISDRMSESHPLNGTTPYAASKSATDLLLYSYGKTFGVDYSVLRPFNNYGPRQNEGNYAGVIPITVKRLLGGQSPVICGTGEQTRDYIYVTDTADAAVQIYNKTATRGKVVNVGSGKEIRIDHLIRTIMSFFDTDGTVLYEPRRSGDVDRHISDVSLAEDLIDFRQKVSFEEGIRMTVEWYKENL